MLPISGGTQLHSVTHPGSHWLGHGDALHTTHKREAAGVGCEWAGVFGGVEFQSTVGRPFGRNQAHGLGAIGTGLVAVNQSTGLVGARRSRHRECEFPARTDESNQTRGFVMDANDTPTYMQMVQAVNDYHESVGLMWREVAGILGYEP